MGAGLVGRRTLALLLAAGYPTRSAGEDADRWWTGGIHPGRKRRQHPRPLSGWDHTVPDADDGGWVGRVHPSVPTGWTGRRDRDTGWRTPASADTEHVYLTGRCTARRAATRRRHDEHLDAADERSSVDLGGRRSIKKKTDCA